MKGGSDNNMRSIVVVFLCVLYIAVYAVIPSPPAKAKKKSEERKRVYLVHADELTYDRWRNNGAQVLRGNVQFEHDGARLYCDSANYFETVNSFEAWGNVKMVQGDTLSLSSDYGFYDGDAKRLEAKTFTSGQRVVLRNRTTTLYTDTLYFDRIDNMGYYDDGGKLVDNTTTLTSVHGEYHTDSKDAFFMQDVVMLDPNFNLTTDTLVYNTQTKMAHIVGPSDIVSGKSHIYSELGYYNTATEQAELLKRSRLDNEGRTLVGDSIWYDGVKGVSEAFVNVIYTDKVNKNSLYCNYGYYNDSTGYAMCTDSAMAVDFSQTDSLYMHADTFKVFSYNLNTDSVYRVLHAYNKVRAYRIDIQAVCDSLVYNSLDSCMTLYRDPIVWNLNQQLLGEEIKVYMKDSVIDHAHVISQAFSIEKLREDKVYNQVSSQEMFAFFLKGEMHEARAVGNVQVVFYPEDDSDSSYVGLISMTTEQLKMFFDKRKLDYIWAPAPDGIMYPMSQIPPEKRYLEDFNWFDYVRPVSKQDIFNWRSKAAGTELKPQRRRNNEAARKQI